MIKKFECIQCAPDKLVIIKTELENVHKLVVVLLCIKCDKQQKRVYWSSPQ